MKFKDFKSSATIIYAVTLFTLLFLNVFLGIRPIAEYINFLERSHLYFLIPLSLLIPIGLFLLDRVRNKKLFDEKVVLFHTTFRSVQDIVKDLNAKTKALINEMQEAVVDEKLLNGANDIFEKSNSVLNSLSNLDI